MKTYIDWPGTVKFGRKIDGNGGKLGILSFKGRMDGKGAPIVIFVRLIPMDHGHGHVKFGGVSSGRGGEVKLEGSYCGKGGIS